MYMQITGYDIIIGEKYHESKVKVKVKVTKNMKITVWAIPLELDVVETSILTYDIPVL